MGDFVRNMLKRHLPISFSLLLAQHFQWRSRPSLRYLMWAAYLTGFRQGDLRRLKRSDLTPDVIEIIQSKDGKHEIREWSESLRKVVRRALQRPKTERVFTNSYGYDWTGDSIQCAMRRMKGKTGIKWRFHDLRAKAKSDHATGLGLMLTLQTRP